MKTIAEISNDLFSSASDTIDLLLYLQKENTEKDREISRLNGKLHNRENLFLIYANHKDTCNIIESIEEGRADHNCSCGLEEYRTEFRKE